MNSLRRAGPLLLILPCMYLSSLCSLCLCGSSKDLDPAAWGGDHVGKPLPEYVTGGECLFCHRTDIGPAWPANRHQRTVREVGADDPALAALKQAPALKGFADEVKYVLGGDRRQRFLKSSAAYGKLELLSAQWSPPQAGAEGKLIETDRPHWDGKKFADACAGCHATAVDAKARTFSALSLDCYVCHGDVPLKHSKEPELVHLSGKRKDPARVVISICAQCHVRTGKSTSTGLPYPNHFVAGDNLFRDFKVDFSEEKIKALNPADRHVLENVRDVVLRGKEDVTCLSCHDVHKPSSRKHRRVAESDLCLTCHNPTGSRKVRKGYEVHSATCGY